MVGETVWVKGDSIYCRSVESLFKLSCEGLMVQVQGWEDGC